ncbi:hypothetical protein DFS34DRAFT_628782 [Phlyctochytrium arcticum]|nr:hypothetical protein DFS34DRAFT_628782 [Phlyctochytrium arcticum]
MSMRRRPTASRGDRPASPAPAGGGAGGKSSDDAPVAKVDLSPPAGSPRPFVQLSLALVVILGLHLVGLYLFASGFLLTRLELETRSNCTTFRPFDVPDPAIPFLPVPLNATENGSEFHTSDRKTATPDNKVPQGCWHPARYERAVLIVLDALRFDFTVYNETLAEQEKKIPFSTPFYLNKLPVIHEATKNEPGHALLFRARADPPTTTLQRLKALTTGTLPTFVDAGSNFFGQIIGEDNLIEQFTRSGRRVVFMGDDTWDTMYPGGMNESYPYPSFEVWDLHSVDNGILNHLGPTLDRDPKDWHLLIAHFLGVDHAGHRYGPFHPEMADKLTQMNIVLKKVMEELDDETVMFVIGDHGMDAKGDHGGDSENEINAGLFMYSKKPLTDSKATDELAAYLADIDEMDLGSSDPFVSMDGHRTVPQIDFVPTISTLLGVPIPYGNLGTLIPETFYVPGSDFNKLPVSHALNLLQATRVNALQIESYITEYSGKRLGAKFAIAELLQLFDEAEAQYENYFDKNGKLKPSNADKAAKITKELYLQYTRFTRRALVAARKIWARFDVPIIVLGAIISTLAFLSTLLFRLFQWNGETSIPWIGSLLGGVVGTLLSVTDVLHPVLAYFETSGESTLSKHHEILFATAGGFMLAYILSTLPKMLVSGEVNVSRLAQRPSAQLLLALTLFVLHIAIPGSDSFTIHEDSITVYLLQAFGFMNLLWAVAVDRDAARDKLIGLAALFMLMTRLSQYSTICREEQHPYCIPTFNATPLSSVAAPHAVLLLFLIIPVVVATMRKLMRSSDNDQSTGKIIPNIFLPFGLLVSAGYWTLDTLDNSNALESATWNVSMLKFWWARVGFLAVGVSSLFLWLSDPNCVGVDVLSGAAAQALGISGGAKTVCFLGIPNAVGASFLVLTSVVYMILTFFQKPMGGLMLGLAMLQLLCLLEMMHIWRDKVDGLTEDGERRLGRKTTGTTTPTSEELQDIQRRQGRWMVLYLVAIYLLAARYYFATGHQYTLSTIQWDIGYVGVKQLSWTISPVLVLANTFAGHILFALAVPLIALWKRPLTRRSEKRLGTELGLAVLAYATMISASTLSAILFAGHFRRHLMVWRVYAPKFFFAALSMILVQLVLLLGSMAVYMPVKGYRDFLTKMKRLGIIRS